MYKILSYTLFPIVKNSAPLTKSPKKRSRNANDQKSALQNKKFDIKTVLVKPDDSMNDPTDNLEELSNDTKSDNIQLFMIDNIGKGTSYPTEKAEDLNASSERHLLSNVSQLLPLAQV